MSEAISLIQSLAWPVLLGAVVVYFGRDLKAFLKQAHEFRVGLGPFKFTAMRDQVEAAVSLAAAVSARRDPSEPRGSTADIRDITSLVSEAASPKLARRLAETTVLWVDDEPDNNLYERRALEALGVRVVTSLSTTDALKRFANHRFDVVISDMGRQEDSRAGYVLLDALQKDGVTVPFVIYAGSSTVEQRIMARNRGAFGSTDDPQELFQLVIDALNRS